MDFVALLNKGIESYASGSSTFHSTIPNHHVYTGELSNSYNPVTFSSYAWGDLSKEMERSDIFFDAGLQKYRFKIDDIWNGNPEDYPFYLRFYNTLYRLLSISEDPNREFPLFNFRKLCFNETVNHYGRIALDLDEKMKMTSMDLLAIRAKTSNELEMEMRQIISVIYKILSVTNPTCLSKKTKIHWTISQNVKKIRNYHIVIDIFLHRNHMAYTLIYKELAKILPKLDANAWDKRSLRVNGFYSKKDQNFYKPVLHGYWKDFELVRFETDYDNASYEAKLERFLNTTLLCNSLKSIIVPIDAEVTNNQLALALRPPAPSRPVDNEDIMEIDPVTESLGDAAAQEFQKQFESLNKDILGYLDREEPLDTWALQNEVVFDVEKRKKWLKGLLKTDGVFRLNFILKLDKKLPKIIMKEFNKHFAYLDYSQEVIRRQLNEFGEITWDHMSASNFRNAYPELQLDFPSKTKGKDGQIKSKTIRYNFVKIWLNSPIKRTFTRSIFDPETIFSYGDAFNRFNGFRWSREECDEAASNEAASALANLLDKHICEFICDNDMERIVFLYKWLCCRVHFPKEKIKLTLVINGHQGSGKSSWISWFSAYFMSHAYVCSTMNRQLKSQFNAHLMDKLLVVLEEGFWAGNSESFASFKAMITESRTESEAKFQNKKQVKKSFQKSTQPANQ